MQQITKLLKKSEKLQQVFMSCQKKNVWVNMDVTRSYLLAPLAKNAADGTDNRQRTDGH